MASEANWKKGEGLDLSKFLTKKKKKNEERKKKRGLLIVMVMSNSSNESGGGAKPPPGSDAYMQCIARCHSKTRGL